MHRHHNILIPCIIYLGIIYVTIVVSEWCTILECYLLSLHLIQLQGLLRFPLQVYNSVCLSVLYTAFHSKHRLPKPTLLRYILIADH